MKEKSKKQGKVRCPSCEHSFEPPRITLTHQAIIDRYGPYPIQCPNCRHVWSQKLE